MYSEFIFIVMYNDSYLFLLIFIFNKLYIYICPKREKTTKV